MAGKRQHHVWQMLQRGFSTEDHGDHHIWVYRKNSEPKQTVTRKFGQENFFYGPEGSDADRNISQFENSVQGTIQTARNAKNGTELNREILAALVSHLEMRSFYLRAEMSRIGERALEIFNGYLSSENHTKILLSAYAENHPEVIDDAIGNADVPENMREIVRAMAVQLLPQQIADGATKIAANSKEIFTPVIEKMAETAKDAHIRSLEANFAHVERTQGHMRLRYLVCRNEREQFILPDTSLAFFKKRGCTPVTQKGDLVECVVIPVSSHVAIIGMAEGAKIRDHKTINKVLAGCAYDAFLAQGRPNNFLQLSNRISRHARLMGDGELKRNLKFSELLKL